MVSKIKLNIFQNLLSIKNNEVQLEPEICLFLKWFDLFLKLNINLKLE